MGQVFNDRQVIPKSVLNTMCTHYELDDSENGYVLRIFEKAYCEFHGTEEALGRPEADYKEYVGSGIFPYYVLRLYMVHNGEKSTSPHVS